MARRHLCHYPLTPDGQFMILWINAALISVACSWLMGRGFHILAGIALCRRLGCVASAKTLVFIKRYSMHTKQINCIILLEVRTPQEDRCKHTHKHTTKQAVKVSNMCTANHQTNVYFTSAVRRRRRDGRLTFDWIHTEGGSISTLRWQKIDVLPDGYEPASAEPPPSLLDFWLIQPDGTSCRQSNLEPVHGCAGTLAMGTGERWTLCEIAGPFLASRGTSDGISAPKPLAFFCDFDQYQTMYQSPCIV